MRLMILTNQLTPGDEFVVRLANELVRRGHQVLVASGSGALAERLDPAVAVARVSTGALSPWGLWRLAVELRPHLHRAGIELIHANTPTTALAARMARPHRGIPVLASAHGLWSPWGLPGVARLFSCGADRVVGCSEATTAELVRMGLARDKVRTILNGVPTRSPSSSLEDRAAVRSELEIPLDSPVILSTARLDSQKGLVHLLEAMPAILRMQPTAKWLVAGDGPLRSVLAQRARRLGVSWAIRFLGERSDVERLLLASDVFCLPSLHEGLPLSVAEAMATGLPVVATPVGGVPEVVLDGVTGWLVPPGHPGLLGARIIALLADPSLRRHMGGAGSARAAALFRLDRMVSCFEVLYADELQLRRRLT